MMERSALAAAADAELVQLVRAGGDHAETAATELFGRYRGRVYGCPAATGPAAR